MTITSITEARIRDHRRNAEIFIGFAVLAEEDGKVCMATLYRRAAEGHVTAADRLEDQIKSLHGASPTVQAQNLLKAGFDSEYFRTLIQQSN